MNNNNFASQRINTASFQNFSGPTLPITTTTQPGETAADLPPTGAAAVSSRFSPNPESPVAKETLIMDNKDNVLFSWQTAEENRKQLLKELAANIEQLCLALSTVSPHLVEIHKTNDCNAKQSFDTTWFQKISRPTLLTTKKSDTTVIAPSSTKSAAVPSHFIQQPLARKHTGNNYAAR